MESSPVTYFAFEDISFEGIHYRAILQTNHYIDKIYQLYIGYIICKEAGFMTFTKTERQINTSLELTGRELLFVIAVFLKMIVEILSLTVIPYMAGENFCEAVFKIMTYTSYGLVVISFLLTPKITTSEIIRIMVLVVITAAGSYFAGNGILLTLIYLYAAKDINVEKVFLILGYIYILLFILIVLLSLLGIIENWDYPQGGSRPTRWGLGYTYPTHTSSVLFMSVLIFCYIQKEQLNLVHVAVLELINLWVFSYTDSRAGMMLCAVIPIVFYLLKFRKKEFRKTVFGWLQQWSFPVCAILIYVVTMAYKGTGFLTKLDSWLSGRLYYSNYSMHEYGVHLFGQKIVWIGYGGLGHTHTQLADVYNFVDTSYLKLLLENGLIVWLLIMIMWTAVSILAYRNNKRYLTWAFTFLAVYSIVEQWLMNLGTNPFLIFLGVYIFRAIIHVTDRENNMAYLREIH